MMDVRYTKMWWLVVGAVGLRVFNAMPFNRENELLDVRVMELGHVVDAFILVECRYTQFGTPKPIRYVPHPSPKVHHFIMEWRPKRGQRGCKLGWILERKQRDYIIQTLAVIPHDPHDILIINDADEIPSSSLVQRLRDNPPAWGTEYPIHMERYLYNFGWLEPQHSQMAGVARIDTWKRWKFDSIRPIHGRPIPNGGWHCTKCFNHYEFNARFKDYLCGDGARWGDYEWSNYTIGAMLAHGIWPGNTPDAPRPESVDAMQHAPRGAWRYPHLVYPHQPDPGPIQMPYCRGHHRDMNRLVTAWCH